MREDDERTQEATTEPPAAERQRERDDVAEPDAPTSGEENDGLSTVLSADTPTGVQKDASDE